MILLKASQPSPAQLEAGNYRKGRVRFQGLPVSIENPAGSTRSGRDRGGREWSIKMKHSYGYVRGTQGVDGDHFDVYLGPNEKAETAFVVTTMAPPAFDRVDEQKAMLGFETEDEARAAFLAHYDNPKFLGSITAIPMARFKAALATTREQPRLLKAVLDAYFGSGLEPLCKALAAGERWITVRPNGPGTEGHPLLIKPAGDGSMKVIGGAGGKLNHLRLTGVKSEADYSKEAAEKSKAYREQRKRQADLDKRDGLKENKKAAREAVRDQVRAHEAKFVQSVAKALGWKDEEVRFPEEKFRNLSPAAHKKAAGAHARAIMQRARDAVEQQRQQLVQDAEMRGAADLGEVPLESAKPEELSVQDLAPVPPTPKGLGFAPAYEARSGLQEGEARKEAEAFRPAPARPRPEGAPSPAEKRKEVGQAIAKELEGIRDPLPQLDPAAKLDAKAAVELLKAEKVLKAAKKAAIGENRKIDAAKEPVEPKAYVVEVAGVAPDKAITADLENDLRTLRTRAFLDDVGKENQDSLGRHIGIGAYNSVNALALAAGGGALLDRSTVDVLGIAGAAQVLARRLASDLTPEEFETAKDAMGRFHTDHYMRLSDKALREARDWHDMADEIELGEARDATDLQAAQELNARRREFIGNAERVLGTAYGEMEANAALTLAMEQPKKAELKASLGALPLDQAITRLRAIGLERGDYQLERIGPSTMLTITGAGMDRLARPVSRDDLARTKTALDIIEGRQDEDDWLPAGVTRRSDAVMAAKPGVAPRLAQPFKVGAGGVAEAVQDYIGGRAADGDSPADIMAGLLSEDTLQRSGDRAALIRAVDEVCPLYSPDGKLVRAETYADKFAELADIYVRREHGETLAPIHKQQFTVDQIAVDALHQALAKTPEGVAAFKPIGDLSPQDQAALRSTFAADYGRADPAAEGMRQELEALGGAEPEREVEDMFGRGPNPAHADWRAKRDELAGKVNAATMTWGKYLEVMGSPANAYRAMQDVIRSKVLADFTDAHNRARPDAALKLGRTVIANDLSHLDALDPAAREKRLADHRALADSLRNRVAGKYAAGAVADKLDAARAHEEAFGQSQMGLFGPTDPPDEDDAPPTERKPLSLGERHTIGHAAERQVAAMMPNMGDFKAGQPVPLWQPTMSGRFIGRQRAVKHIRQMKRTVLGLGVGSGKTSISLAAFTDAHAAGDAKRGLFVVPSVVQGQFHGEALTLLEAGKYNWHCNPGADRAERIAAYKNPDLHFNVVTHQAFRDDMLHLASQREGTTPDEVSAKLDAMSPAERRDYMRDLMAAEGMSHDYLAVDEGHNLLNRAGKENSRMSNVIDGVAHGMRTHVSMSADPVKNDPSEAFDILAKMDPERYSDRDAFMRRYGVNTASSRDELRREMARHFYTGAISSGVNADRREMPIKLAPEQVEHMDRLDAAAAKARLARMRGDVDVEALHTLSPNSFEGVDPAQHETVAKDLNRSIGIIKNGAMNRALSGKANDQAISDIAQERKGKPGVVFTHNLGRVAAIKARLEAEGHRVVTLTGGDSSKDKARKLEEYKRGQHDVLVASDAGAVGANMQAGKWLVQDDTPATAMAQPLHAKILTPTGWRDMGSLITGDLVMCPDGTVAPIVGVHPQGIKPIYRVTFSDGASTLCCMDHLWATKSRDDVKKKRGWRVRTLAHIDRTLTFKDGELRRPVYHIPLVGQIEFPSYDMPIDPYVLGVLLGDGSFGARHVEFAAVDPEIVERVRVAAADIDCFVSQVAPIRYRLVGDKVGFGYPRRSRSPMLEAARSLGIRGGEGAEKTIPVQYLFASSADRLALLQGLMDTDGTVDKRNGHTSFCSTSRDLIDGVMHLARSLGGVASVGLGRQSVYQGNAGRIHWKVSLSLPVGINPFSLPRKAIVVEGRERRLQMRRAIVAIEFVGREKAQCIEVGHPDHLYVTDDFIVTHNTHAQRNGRINRMGQTSDVELIDLVPDHPEARRARKRLANKYELRDIMTSPLEGLDDSGLAGYLHRAQAGEAEAAEPVHAPTPRDQEPVQEDEQASMF